MPDANVNRLLIPTSIFWGSNIGLERCRSTRVKMEAGCRMTKMLMSGCGIKILQREWDFFILIRGLRNENIKSNVSRRTSTFASCREGNILIMAARQDWAKIERGCGTEKVFVRHSYFSHVTNFMSKLLAPTRRNLWPFGNIYLWIFCYKKNYL